MKRIILIALGIAAVGGMIFAYLQMSKERAAEREREKPVASESEIRRNAGGETVITMDDEARKQIGLMILPLAAAQLQPEVKGYGRELDPALLSAAATELVSARATGEASQKELARLQALAGQNNASARALEAAQAAASRDAAQSELARMRFVVAWGKAIASREDLPDFLESLSSGESSLVRIDLLAGELLKTQPMGARLFVLSDETNSVEANFIGPATAVDAQTQGQGFLFLVKSRQTGFAPGAAVIGYLKISGDARSGVMIPRGAVVRFNGRPWIYLQMGGQTFVRREISEERPLAEGWFAAQGVKAGDLVVVSGAQMLLSEEQKYQIRVGD